LRVLPNKTRENYSKDAEKLDIVNCILVTVQDLEENSNKLEFSASFAKNL
jgi:hypothetical protein